MNGSDCRLALRWLVVLVSWGTVVLGQDTGANPLPTGGTSMLPADTLAAFGPWGKTETVTTETVAVTGQPFTKACRITTSRALTNTWEAGYGTYLQKPIRKGDVLLLRFYLRAIKGQPETGEAMTSIGAATAGPAWAKSMAETVGITNSWKQYNYPFTALFDTPVNGSLVQFDIGYGPQSFEVAGLDLINYGQTRTMAELPKTRRDYAGQEDDAPWRKAANARIERIRRGDLKISVVDADGKPVAGAKVAVRMQRHAYAFGTAVAADRLVGSDSDSEKYRQIVLDNYNAAVIENHLKWPFWESWGKADGDRAVTWLSQNQMRIPINGPLVWGGWGNLPDDLKAKQNDKEFILRRIRDNMAKEMGAYQGKLTEWEVINEPYAQNDLWKLFGYEQMADVFREARRVNPTAHLTINDYPPLDGAATTNEHLNSYYGYIADLVKAKAPLDGIGFQCHFGSSVVPPERVLAGLDRFARFGLPISITEFDMQTADEDLQRRYMRDFLTAVFSHPSTDAILMWGFWERQHWMPAAALYRSDWSIKPNGQMWLDLVKRDWWTNADGKTDGAGVYRGRGFYGVYAITAAAPGGKSKTVYHTLTKDGAPLVVKLDNEVPAPPAWLAAKLEAEREYEARLAAGIVLLSGDEFNMLSDKANGTSQMVDVAGQTFARATRFNVLKTTPQPWNVQALIVTRDSIAKGDLVKVSFWVRSAPGATGGDITANFQTGEPEYAIYGTTKVVPTATWQQVRMEFAAPEDRSAGRAMLVLQLGRQVQAVEVGGVVAAKYRRPETN